jgi:hypothetical protein
MDQFSSKDLSNNDTYDNQSNFQTFKPTYLNNNVVVIDDANEEPVDKPINIVTK